MKVGVISLSPPTYYDIYKGSIAARLQGAQGVFFWARCETVPGFVTVALRGQPNRHLAVVTEEEALSGTWVRKHKPHEALGMPTRGLRVYGDLPPWALDGLDRIRIGRVATSRFPIPVRPPAWWVYSDEDASL